MEKGTVFSQTVVFNRIEMSKFKIKLISDMTDQVFFLAIFFAGLFLITGLKLTDSPLTSAFIAVLLLCVYAFSSHRLIIFKLSAEKIGDNSYYLGFLFTLISLSNALYLFTDGQDQNQIVSDFGIALASTIAGILLRIIFNQMKVEPDQVEDTIKETLTEVSIRLSGELENVVDEVGNVTSSLSNLMKDSLKEVEGVIAKSAIKHQELASSIELVTDNIIDRNKKIAISIESVTESIIERNKEAIDQIQGSVAKLGSENIDQLKAPLDDIQNSLTSLSNHLRDTQASSLTKSLGDFTSALDKNTQKVNQITDTLDAAIEGHKVSKGDLVWNLLTSRFKNKDE